ncbi:Integral membrane protein [hydrothermal vent metagenome]|uniref:Integral membrane protein n=1 Tax=hydrothermal vent metagenome TaxID=652676 RepID=A0A1W1C752_9ZZZZ
MEQFNRYFLDTIKNRYAQFDGRASRSEFWYFALFYFLADLVAAVIDAFVLSPMLGMTPEQISQGGYLQMILVLGLFIPSIALAVRRLHDIGKSGWWYLLVFIPFIGWVVLIYFYVLDSQPGTNQYGENPKGF